MHDTIDWSYWIALNNEFDNITYFKVILSHATNLYFDHPYEPDPEDRGYYWATRYTDTKKAFSYIAENVYDNIEVGLMGNKLTKSDICSIFTCTELEQGKERNIIGRLNILSFR